MPLNRQQVIEIIANKGSLVGANMAGADLSRLNFESADLRGAVLVGASLRASNFRHARLDRANLSGTDVGDADFTLAWLDNANLEGTRGGRTKFGNASMRGASLANTTIYSPSFGGADLEGAWWPADKQLLKKQYGVEIKKPPVQKPETAKDYTGPVPQPNLQRMVGVAARDF